MSAEYVVVIEKSADTAGFVTALQIVPSFRRGSRLNCMAVGRRNFPCAKALSSAVMTSWTAVFVEVPEGYAAFVEELPGANAQGRTLGQARENLHEAVELVLEANRTLAEEALAGKKVIREQLPIAG